MKKTILIICLLLCVFLFVACGRVVREEGLLKIAREEIPIADIENTQVVIAGNSRKDNSVLFWFITGNEYQAHYYAPIEFTDLGNDEYEFVHTYSALEDDMDMTSCPFWKGGYSFLINNENCANIRLDYPDGTVEEIEVTSIPFVYYLSEVSNFSYHFIDKDGNDMCG